MTAVFTASALRACLLAWNRCEAWLAGDYATIAVLSPALILTGRGLRTRRSKPGHFEDPASLLAFTTTESGGPWAYPFSDCFIRVRAAWVALSAVAAVAALPAGRAAARRRLVGARAEPSARWTEIHRLSRARR